MLYWLVRKNCDDEHATKFYLTASQLTLAVRRNFGGSDEFDPLCEFHNCLQSDALRQVCTNGGHVLYLKLEMLFIYMLSKSSVHLPQLHNNAFCTVRW